MPPVPPDPYLVAWAELRRRRVLAVTSFFLLPATVVAMDIPVVARAGGAPMLASTVAILVLTLRARFFRCPHCRKPFSARFRLFASARLPWHRHCLHCRIEMGTAKAAVVESANAQPGADA